MPSELGQNREPFVAQGTWWLPDREVSQVSGTLTYDTDGRISLSAVGVIDDELEPALVMRYPVILGRVVGGTEVTLCRATCIERQAGESSTGQPHETVDVGTVFLGALLPNGADSSFDHVIIEFQNLNAWIASEPLTTHEYVDGVRKLRLSPSTELSLTAPPGQLHVFSGMSESNSIHSVELNRQSHLVVECDRRITDDEAFDTVVRPLQQFFTFASDAACQIVSLSYGTTDITISESIPFSRRIFVIHSGERQHSSDPVAEHDMLFRFLDVKGDPQKIFSRWFEWWKRLNPAMDLLFGTMLGPETYVETRFLLLAQAAEVYSRLRFPDDQKQGKEHKQRRDRVVESVADEDDRSWLKEALAHYHEPTFSEKLEGLVRHAGPHAADITRTDFPNVVKATRNYFTHYDNASLKRAVTKAADLYRLGNEVVMLLTLCLLTDLDFNETEAWTLLTRTPRSRAFRWTGL